MNNNNKNINKIFKLSQYMYNTVSETVYLAV